MPLCAVLDERGVEVKRVAPHDVKQVPGRTTDARDCRWLQAVQTCGLRQGAFRPAEPGGGLRSSLRQRSLLMEAMARPIHSMQQAVEQMNLQWPEVVSDMTGKTGRGMLWAMVAGERPPPRVGPAP